jgi:aryl-alcohol dehydrogenase-like predicted oxidoreductase
MEQVGLGSSGLRVSQLALGCMSFGEPGKGEHSWVLDRESAKPIFLQALELGINFWDTANVYGAGASEEVVGHAARTYARREELVLATKVYGRMHAGPGGSGLSRLAILGQVDASLRRLGTDYIDLYQIHRFDPRVPMEETMEALHDVVRTGKARYIGASSMWAWQFASLQHVAATNGWTSFVSMQNQYSLLQREEEREMLPLLAHQGVGSIPWSPLARGRLARAWGITTERSEGDEMGRGLYLESDRLIVDAVETVARERGVGMAQVALAWVLRHPVVAAPIVGATKSDHLREAAAAVDLELTDDEVRRLEEAYSPRSPTGF